jgi:hypothetical protein
VFSALKHLRDLWSRALTTRIMALALLTAALCMACQEPTATPTPTLTASPCDLSQALLPLSPPPGVTPQVVLDSAQLRAALEGPCRAAPCWLKLAGAFYQGSFLIPPGAWLEGTLAEGQAPQLYGDPATQGAALRLEPHDGCALTVLRNLDIYADGVGVSASGGSALALEGVRVNVTRGAGILALGLRRLHARHLVLRTELTLEDLRQVPEALSPAQWPALGLLIDGAQDLQLEDLWIAGFAAYGAAIRDSAIQARGLHIYDNQGYGLFVTGPNTTLSLDDATIERTRRSGLWLRHVPAGLVLTDGAAATTDHLQLLDNAGLGALQSGATATHRNLTATGNSLPGYWIQRAAPDDGRALTLDGADLSHNHLAGLVALHVRGLDLQRVQVLDTIPIQTFEDLNQRIFADGLHLVALEGDLRLRDLDLTNNRRAGLFLDGAAATAPLLPDITDVRIAAPDAPDDALGLVAQDLLAPLPTDGIQRPPELIERDGALTARLPAAAASSAPTSTSNTSWLGDGGLFSLDGAPNPNARLGAAGLGENP